MIATPTPQPIAETKRVTGPQTLEKAAIIHASFLVIFVSWSFGGNIRWAEQVVVAVGLLGGGAITAIEFLRRRRTGGSLRPFHWLWPLVGLTALVLVGALYPNLQSLVVEGASVWVPRSVSPLLPSSARPDLAIGALLLFIGLFLPCFNVAVVVRSRRLVRALLWTMVTNAFVLAVFGSLQKLSHASGLYFGAVPSPNTRFFASFVYQNHWGAFAVLHLSLGLGLVFSAKADSRYRSFLQSPACLALVGLLFLAASIPLSASRSCTVLVALLLGMALFTTWRRMAEGKLQRKVAFLVLGGAAFLVVLATILARPVMQSRLADTRQQLAMLRSTGSIGTRAQLYRETWEMVQDRPFFGWGLASYPWVFARYNRQVSVDRLPVHYEDAHSDWLQSLAEVGVVGTVCRGLLLLLPLWSIRRLGRLPVVSFYPLLGCAIILLYALVEFPFGNPAVILTFWLCWFAALRIAQLEARESGG